jgi:hypothetical protein
LTDTRIPDDVIRELVKARQHDRGVIADLLMALKNYQNYHMTLESRQNVAMAAISRAERRRQ